MSEQNCRARVSQLVENYIQPNLSLPNIVHATEMQVFTPTAEGKHKIGQICDLACTQHLTDCMRVCPVIMIAENGKGGDCFGKRRERFDQILEGLLGTPVEDVSDQKISGKHKEVGLLGSNGFHDSLKAFSIHPATHVNVANLNKAQAGKGWRKPPQFQIDLFDLQQAGFNKKTIPHPAGSEQG